MRREIVAIPGCPGYGASRDGSIWSIRRAGIWRRIKTQRYKKTGYLYLTLGLPAGQTTFLVHRLVALTFLGPRPEGYEINHKDGFKLNNRANNLEYITYLDNLEHAWDNGLIVIGKPKLSSVNVLDIRERLAKGESDTSIAKVYNVYPTSIRDIRLGKTWKGRVSISAA